jgi:hypothetical protein
VDAAVEAAALDVELLSEAADDEVEVGELISLSVFALNSFPHLRRVMTYIRSDEQGRTTNLDGTKVVIVIGIWKHFEPSEKQLEAFSWH